MATFQEELESALGESGDLFDIRASVRRCFFYDFSGYPVRLWEGHGKFIDSDGNEWHGTFDISGTNHHQAPAVKDSREGTSPRYEFGLPHIDQNTFDALKADRTLIDGRRLTVYHAIFRKGEGVRAGTPIRFSYSLEMKGVRFDQGVSSEGGSLRRQYSAFVLCRNLEAGRSRFPGGTYTDLNQNQRAALLGLASDSGCVFVAGNSRRTYTFE